MRWVCRGGPRFSHKRDSVLDFTRVIGLNTVEMNRFALEGQYLYQLELPEEMKNKRFMFHRGNACVMENLDTGSVYRVYGIKNFPASTNA